MPRSVGAELLQCWRVGGGHSYNAAAKLLGTDRETYARWEDGSGLPSLRFAATCAGVAGVPMESWLTAATAATAKSRRSSR